MYPESKLTLGFSQCVNQTGVKGFQSLFIAFNRFQVFDEHFANWKDTKAGLLQWAAVCVVVCLQDSDKYFGLLM